jgi:hypothetical protein
MSCGRKTGSAAWLSPTSVPAACTTVQSPVPGHLHIVGRDREPGGRRDQRRPAARDQSEAGQRGRPADRCEPFPRRAASVGTRRQCTDRVLARAETGRPCLPDPNGVVTFRLVEVRPGWVPPGPRGRWFAPGRSLDTGQHLPPSSGGPCSPASSIPSAGVHVTRRHRRFTCVHPSGLSPACSPPDGTGGLGRLPGLRTPRSLTAHARAGTVPAN